MFHLLRNGLANLWIKVDFPKYLLLIVMVLITVQDNAIFLIGASLVRYLNLRERRSVFH